MATPRRRSTLALTTGRLGGRVSLSPRQPSHHHNGTGTGLLGDRLKRLLPLPFPACVLSLVGLRGRYPPTPFSLSLSSLENKEPSGHSLKQKCTFNEVLTSPMACSLLQLPSLFPANSYLSFKTRFNQRFSGTRLLLSSEPPLGLVPTSIAGSPGH